MAKKADIQELEDEIAKLRLEVERAEAIRACINLGNKYQTYHGRMMRTEEMYLFALGTPGGAVEMLWGIYDEPEGIIKWKIGEGFAGRKRLMNVVACDHAMSTPIIEVAKDGQTAKGLWIMFNHGNIDCKPVTNI